MPGGLLFFKGILPEGSRLCRREALGKGGTFNRFARFGVKSAAGVGADFVDEQKIAVGRILPPLDFNVPQIQAAFTEQVVDQRHGLGIHLKKVIEPIRRDDPQGRDG